MNEQSATISTTNNNDKNAGRFDAHALYEALDTQRRSRGMTWQQVGTEVGVSVPTLTRTKLGGRMEVDGMLAMVRWLDRTAESFTRGPALQDQATL
ncbi:MAG: hypothetical protein ACRYFS_04840 [Janthinobacterium lividum]